MGSILHSGLTREQRADAAAWDAKAAAALVSDARTSDAFDQALGNPLKSAFFTNTPGAVRKLPFDELVEHLTAARSLAAGLVGTFTEADTLHAQLDEALGFARAKCWPVEEQSLADAKHDAEEEGYMEQARGVA